jgi:hypothetical protein
MCIVLRDPVHANPESRDWEIGPGLQSTADNVALTACEEEMGQQKLNCGVNVSSSEQKKVVQKRSTKSVRRGFGPSR